MCANQPNRSEKIWFPQNISYRVQKGKRGRRKPSEWIQGPERTGKCFNDLIKAAGARPAKLEIKNPPAGGLRDMGARISHPHGITSSCSS
jgi:hypothetical protein